MTPTPQPTPLSTDKVIAAHSVDPKQLTGYGWPLKRPWITSKFAPRDFGNFIVIDGVGYHDGLDLATHCGDTVYATHDGTVLVNDRTFDQYLGYEGHPEDIYNRTVRNGHPTFLAIAVVIDDGNGYRSQYMHLKEATVSVGQFVHKGDPIGIEGETGAATRLPRPLQPDPHGRRLAGHRPVPLEVRLSGEDPRARQPDRRAAVGRCLGAAAPLQPGPSALAVAIAHTRAIGLAHADSERLTDAHSCAYTDAVAQPDAYPLVTSRDRLQPRVTAGAQSSSQAR